MTSTEETIVYSNSRNGLGIRILGAKRATHKSGIYIREILEHGLAQTDGRLKVGDQVLSINDESVVGVSREHAVNLLRSSAATNHVRFRVKHFHPSLSSVEYQKLLHDEKSTDDDEDHRNHHRITPHNNNDDEQVRKSSRRHHRTRTAIEPNAYNVAYESSKRDHEQNNSRVDLSPNAMQALLNSRFKLIDLLDLMKKLYPELFGNDQRRELQFIEQLSQTNSDGRMTLKDFERQSSVLLGERIDLLVPFFSSATNENDVRRELASCRATIDELQTKITACEKSQRLSQEVELEYEDLLKFLYEQLHRHKSNEVNHLKQVRANDQLIHKLFNYLSIYVTQPRDEHILTQLKYEYEQQQKFVANSHSTFQERF